MAVNMAHCRAHFEGAGQAMTLTGYRLAWLQKAARTGSVLTSHFGACSAALAAATWLIDQGLMRMDLASSYHITDAGQEVLQQQLKEKSQ